MLIFWPYGCFFPFKCQVVRINTIDDFHFCFIRIVFQMLFKVPELPQTLPLAQVYTIFTFICHKTFSSRSFSLPLTNVVRQILWFPDGFFLIVQQNHKPNYGSSRKSASSNLHLQLCTRERERNLKCAMLVARTSYHSQPGFSWTSYLYFFKNSPLLCYLAQSSILDLS